jgi:integrase/recombinase XerD
MSGILSDRRVLAMSTTCIPSTSKQETTLELTSMTHGLQPFVIAHTNEDLIQLWLHGKSLNTCDGYKRDIQYSLTFINNKLLSTVTLNDVQAFANRLIEHSYAPSTQRRRLTAVKSLLTYGYDLEVLGRNVGQRIQLPKVKVTIAERILSESQVLSLLSHTTKLPDHALL